MKWNKKSEEILALPEGEHVRLRVAVKARTTLTSRSEGMPPSERKEPFPVRPVAKYGLSLGLSNEKLKHAIVGLTYLQRLASECR